MLGVWQIWLRGTGIERQAFCVCQGQSGSCGRWVILRIPDKLYCFRTVEDDMDEDPKQGDLFEAPEDQEVKEKREKILSKIRRERELNSVQSRVAYILSQYPETRNSDITLQIQYWQVFQGRLLSGGMITFDNLYQLERLTTLKRARAYVQNTLKLFQATDDRVAKHRKQLDEEKRQEYASSDISAPGLFVYADESGKNADHLIVGSAWMLSTGDYPRFVVESNDWREQNDVNYELHSSDLGKYRLEKYKDFIKQFVLIEGILGFKAISIPNSGFSDKDKVIADLYYWILRRGLEHEIETKRISLPRRLSFAKDAEEEGYDERVLALVRDQLERDADTIFDGDLYYSTFGAIDSEEEILIQIADLFTWCVNRKLNVIPDKDGSNWKDEFAMWFLSSVQFDLSQEKTEKDRAVVLSLNSPTIDTESIEIYETPESELQRFGSSGEEEDENDK